MKLIFKNREVEKEMLYYNSIKDKVHTVCCHVDLEKEAYKQDLIKTNRNQDGHRSNYTDWIRCFCGRMLFSTDLRAMFSLKEINEILTEIKKPQKESKILLKAEICFHCIKDCSVKSDYCCVCGKFYHNSCLPKIGGKCLNCEAPIEKSLPSSSSHSDIFVPRCCQKEVGSKAEYIQEFIEYNLKRREGKEIMDETRMVCHLCAKTTSKEELEKFLLKKDIEEIKSKLFSRKCAECNGEINSQDSCIKNDCGHFYHISCADFINQDRKSFIKKCRAKNCEAILKNFEEKIRLYKEEESKKCLHCKKPGRKLLEFNCKHYLCHDCGVAFRKGENACISHETHTTIFCSLCQDDSIATRITLNCSHTLEIKKLQFELKGELQQFERIGKMGIVTCLYPQCDNSLDDVEIYALMGPESGVKILSYIESVLNNVKKSASVKREAQEKTNKMEENYGIKIGFCEKCKRNAEGYYRFFCHHMFICKNCIIESIGKAIEKSGLKEYCIICDAPTNYYYLKFLIDYPKGTSPLASYKINEYKKNYVVPSPCCRSHYAIRGKYFFMCSSCGKKYKQQKKSIRLFLSYVIY